MSPTDAVRAAPHDAEGGPATECMLGGLPLSHNAAPQPKQDSPYGPSVAEANLSQPSPHAVAAARDTTFEGLVETAALAESYARCLGEAAWRADRLTVEAHLRQLRACVIAGIDMFKMLDGIEAKGGGA